MRAIELAEKLGACEEVFEWLEDEETVQQAWQRCPRGDWMMWTAARLGVDIRPLTLAKARCAATVKHLMKDKRSRNAVEVAEQFGLGNASSEELAGAAHAAADAANAAANVAYIAAADAAVYAADASASDTRADPDPVAAYAAVYAADAAASATRTDAAWATSAAAYAADAAAYAAAHAAVVAVYAYVAERKKNQLATADICRQMLTEPVMEKVLDSMKK